jgi:Protein of unknown function (DUF3306)
MTESEDFLTRWSRRKQDAKIESERDAQVEATPQQAEQAGAEAKTARLADTQREPKSSEDVFDLSKLPSLDSIGPATDIRAFLQPGVPEALSRAALRRAWSADPGIRDFIGLAENSWDFTADDGMHGFGALDPADAKRLFAQLFSEGERASEEVTGAAPAQDSVSDAEASQDEASEPDSTGSAEADAITSEPVPDEAIEMLQNSIQADASVASQQKEAEPTRALPPIPRGHGRALPQ